MKKIIKENTVIIAFLIAWLFVNFIFLLLAKDNYQAKNIFYPFTNTSITYSYDVTEFTVYGITPIVFFLIIKIVKYGKE
jgi:hypothetical protein